MISKLVLKNWKSHMESEFRFSPGTNVLVGIMGSGKSSVLDAICFALFGTFPDLQKRNLKLDQVIMNRPKRRDKAEVELTLEMDNTYTISRTVERGKGTTNSEIRQGGKLLEAPQATRVTETVEEILSVDYELFSRAVYSEQNQLDYFLTIPKGQRMEKIDQLLRLDRFEKARSSASSLTNRCRQRRKDKKDEMGRLKEEGFLKKIPDLERDVRKLEQDREKLSRELEQGRQKLEKLRSSVEDMEERADKVRKLETEMASVRTGLEEARNAEKKLRNSLGKYSDVELEKMEEKYSELMEKVEKNRQRLKSYRQKLESLQSKGSRLFALANQKEEQIEETRKKLKEGQSLKEELGELEKKNPSGSLKNVEKKLEELRQEVGRNNLIISRMRDSLDKLSGDRCPVCDTPLGKEKRRELVSDRKQRIEEAEGGIESAREKIGSLGAKKVRLEAETNRLTVLRERLKGLEGLDLEEKKSELEELREKGNSMDVRMDGLRKEIEELEEKRKDLSDRKSDMQMLLSRRKELEEKIGQKRAYMKRSQRIKENLEAIEFDPQELRSKRQKLQGLIANNSQMKESLKSMENLLKEKKLRLQELKKRRSSLKELAGEVNTLSNIIDFLNKFNQALLDTQEQLRSEFVEAINETMDEIWSEMYPYSDFQSIRLSVQEGDYVLQLKSGEWNSVEGVASGGERTSAALCLRIAFSLILAPNLKWLILDEPTHNLDINAIQSFAKVLKTKVSDIVDQVFVITHEERLEEAVTGSLYKLNRNKAQDAPTKVEALSA